MASTAPRYEDITETTGMEFTREAAGMMQTRYDFAARHAEGRRIVELGCGAGLGLGMLQRAGARRVLGGDYSLALLRDARSHYGDRVPLLRLSATDLPLRDRSFDLVIFFEATYYVPDMEASFREIARILSPQGTLLIASANPERPDFIPSPHSTRYYTAAEFRSSLERLGFRVSVSGAFPVMSSSTSVPRRAGATMLRTIRRILQFLGLVPRTLKGRARLKRLLYGSLVPVPRELTPGFATGTTLAPVSTGPVVDFKVIYIKADRTS